MNERIRQLVRQSGLDDADFPIENWDNVPLEKFAELIVRECAGACLHDDWEDPRWGRFYANKIKQHFGVEE